MPWLVSGFFKLITPFIDPVTREKLKFNEDMTQYVPVEQLWSADWGGELDFEYDHDVYWPALNDLCKQKREDKLSRWTAAGSVVGELEEYLTGGTNVSASGFTYAAANGNGNTAVNEVGELETKLADAHLNEKAAEVENKADAALEVAA